MPTSHGKRDHLLPGNVNFQVYFLTLSDVFFLISKEKIYDFVELMEDYNLTASTEGLDKTLRVLLKWGAFVTILSFALCQPAAVFILGIYSDL